MRRRAAETGSAWHWRHVAAPSPTHPLNTRSPFAIRHSPRTTYFLRSFNHQDLLLFTSIDFLLLTSQPLQCS